MPFKTSANASEDGGTKGRDEGGTTHHESEGAPTVADDLALIDSTATTLNLVTERLDCSQPEPELRPRPSVPMHRVRRPEVGRRCFGRARRLGPGV